LHVCLLTTRRQPTPPLFPYTTLFRSCTRRQWTSDHQTQGCNYITLHKRCGLIVARCTISPRIVCRIGPSVGSEITRFGNADVFRSEEHTSELQSRENLVCRLLLEKKN